MRIGELAQEVGVDPPTVRYYESVGVLPEPDRTPSGYRAYTPEDIERVRFVTLARSLGLHLDDIRQILALRDQGEAPCRFVRDVLDRQVDAVEKRIRQLQELATELHRLRAKARSLPDMASEDPCVCHILQSSKHDKNRERTRKER
ncbi:MAG: heavy metal-responsive transcriptional regulator [Acidimicrobiia bacterium]